MRECPEVELDRSRLIERDVLREKLTPEFTIPFGVARNRFSYCRIVHVEYDSKRPRRQSTHCWWSSTGFGKRPSSHSTAWLGVNELSLHSITQDRNSAGPPFK